MLCLGITKTRYSKHVIWLEAGRHVLHFCRNIPVQNVSSCLKAYGWRQISRGRLTDLPRAISNGMKWTDPRLPPKNQARIRFPLGMGRPLGRRQKKKQPAGLDHGGRIESQQVGYLDIRRWHVWITRTINSSYHPPPRIPTQDVEIITRERLFTHPGTNRIFCTQSSWAIFWTRAKESKRPTLGRKTFFQKLPKPGTGYAWKSGWSLWRLV